MTPSPAHMPVATEPIDIVYTWVDDRYPGYLDLLRQHARHPRDSDPSRTRDNLDTLRYSLRSIERFAPWVNRIHILTCRPQVPAWLNTAHPRISVVHHDEVMPAEALPTFNSLAITSHLHLVPGVSRRFIYFEDDMVLVAPLALTDFLDGGGRPLVFEERSIAPRTEDIADPERSGGWNLALAASNVLLDMKYGTSRRSQVGHSPLLIDKARWQETLDFFPAARDLTVNSRFRSAGNFAPEFLYNQCLLAEGQATLVPHRKARRTAGYIPLEDAWPVTLAFLAMAHVMKPKWLTFNDNFGPNPNRMTLAMVRRLLHHILPTASDFERPLASASA